MMTLPVSGTVSTASGTVPFMFHVDKALYGPNVPVTVRFSPILHQWLREKAAKENISFNQMVLLGCKYVMDEEQANEEAEESGDSHK